ncbi:MAG: FAD-dependent oxidoreductase [Pseudolysinimonas sp.]
MKKSAPQHVVIVGGGVIGLATAWYLLDRGAQVTVLESQTVGSGASFANGGWFCPAQAGPLPEPGLTATAIASFFDPHSALYIVPTHLPIAAPWFLRFWQYCNQADFAKGVSALAALGADTFRLVDEWSKKGVEFELHKQGMVYAAKKESSVASALQKLQPMKAFGYKLPDDLITGDELHRFEPSLSDQITAGFFIEEHWHARSDTLCEGLAVALRARGARVVEGAEVLQVTHHHSGRIESVSTATETIEGDEFVFATGSWVELFRGLGAPRIPIEAGKGYSFAVRPSVMPEHAVLLTDAHVGCTPFGDFMRIGGTMEFSGNNRRINKGRVDSIVKLSKDGFLPWTTDEITDVWSGARPIAPDGLPIVDRLPQFANGYVATGHAMQGVSLAPGTGSLLAEYIVDGSRPAVLEPFRADRFTRAGRRRSRA